MKSFAVISDQHFNDWSAFSQVLSDGHNSRLVIQIQELHRCVDELRKVGGNTIINCGDTFHVRGKVAPSVLNPVMDAHKYIVDSGINMIVLPGNHDLENKESSRISNAVTALERVGVQVVQDYTHWSLASLNCAGIFIPWTPNLEALKTTIESARASSDTYLFIHAPIDNVIPGLPEHGLTAGWLATHGFKGVFCGHYHHNKEFPGNVWSVGASTHQTWSDVGTKAGFLIVSDEGVRWHKSHAPQFIDITANTDADEIPLIVDGNYVRAKVELSNVKDIEDLRAYLFGCGALGVIINPVRTSSVGVRTGSTIKAGASLETSVADYIRSGGFGAQENLVQVECANILMEARKGRVAA